MNRRNAGLVGILVAALFANLISCTKVDDTVGSTLIPDDQRMQIFMDTIYGIDAYLYQEVDTFPLNMNKLGWYYGSIGSKQDRTFGQLESGWFGQYGGATFYTSNAEATDRYGTAPMGDSLYFYMVFDESLHSGDTTKKQKFNVYEVTERRLYADSAYFMGKLNFEKLIDPTPLLTFECTGSEGSISKRMTGSKAEDLMKRLLKATIAQYENDSLFVNEYKGLYVARADNSPKDAAMLGVSLASSSLILYAHNFTDETQKTPKDTIIGNYSFNSGTYTKLLSMNNYKRDYSNSTVPVSRINDSLNTVLVGYVQGCGGLTTNIRFTKKFAEKLHAIAKEDAYTMVINSARLEIGLADPTIDALDEATNRLGFYIDYASFLSTLDYAWDAEVSQYNPVTIPFGGYINRSRNSYTMDITRQIQVMAFRQLDKYVEATTPEEMKALTAEQITERNKYRVTIAPSIFESYNMKQVLLDMRNQPTDPLPLRVVVTYTLVKNTQKT